MGTGIVATAAASLPLQFAGLRTFATVVWAAAALLLAGLTVITALHWQQHRQTARGHHLDPVMSHFYGAPPMAILTVGAGTLLLGKDVVGLRGAVDIDWVLWLAGTITGLFTAAAIPYLQFTRHDVDERSAFGGWLMPIVPPMVSASTGALLVPYAPAGQVRLGQSITAANLLGGSPRRHCPSPTQPPCRPSVSSMASRSGASRSCGADWPLRSPCARPASTCHSH